MCASYSCSRKSLRQSTQVRKIGAFLPTKLNVTCKSNTNSTFNRIAYMFWMNNAFRRLLFSTIRHNDCTWKRPFCWISRLLFFKLIAASQMCWYFVHTCARVSKSRIVSVGVWHNLSNAACVLSKQHLGRCLSYGNTIFCRSKVVILDKRLGGTMSLFSLHTA